MDILSQIDKIIEDRFNEMKRECATYGELERKIKDELQDLKWKDGKTYVHVLDYMERRLKEERDRSNERRTRRIRSKDKADFHIEIKVNGTSEDIEQVLKDVRRMQREVRYSGKRLSYEVELVQQYPQTKDFVEKIADTNEFYKEFAENAEKEMKEAKKANQDKGYCIEKELEYQTALLKEMKDKLYKLMKR